MTRLKTYQLFLLLFGTLIIAIASMPIQVIFFRKFELSIMLILIYFWLIIFYSWEIEMLVKLNALLEQKQRLRGYISIFFAIIALVGAFLLFYPKFQSSTESNFGTLQVIGVILFAIAIFGNFYIFRTIVKNIRTIELGRETHFKDYSEDFFLFFNFIIGLWVLHPRIRKIFGYEEKKT